MHPLRDVVDVCETLIERAEQSGRHSTRTFYGHGLFIKATSHGRSILTLASSAHRIDVGAICVLSRCIMEVFNAASYFLEPKLSKDESHMRLHLFLLNHSIDLEKIERLLNTRKDDGWSWGSRSWSESELESNPIFTSLDEPHRKNLLRGKLPYIGSRYAGAKPVPQAVESGLYTLFSHSAHSFSLGIPNTMDGQVTPAGVENSLLLAADAASLYLASFGLIYWRLRNRAIKKLLPAERSLLEAQATPTQLMARLSSIKKSKPVF